MSASTLRRRGPGGVGALHPRSQIHASALRATAEVSPTCTEAPSAAAPAGLRGPDPVPARTAPRPEAPARLWWRSRQEAPRTFPPWRGKPCPSSVGRRPPGRGGPPACAPTPHLHTVPVPPGSGASGLLAASRWLREVLEAGHADVPRSIAGGSEMRDRRASGSASSLSHGAAGAGRAAPECVQTALAPRSPLTLPVCGRELSRRPNFLCFLMLFFNCFKAAVTVKPGPEPLAPRRRLVQEQARRPAEARHQRHALLALPAHRGKDAVPSARFLGVGLLLSVCVFLTVHMGRAWDRREGYPKGEDIAARNFE